MQLVSNLSCRRGMTPRYLSKQPPAGFEPARA